jgi:hypothetical protein
LHLFRYACALHAEHHNVDKWEISLAQILVLIELLLLQYGRLYKESFRGWDLKQVDERFGFVNVSQILLLLHTCWISLAGPYSQSREWDID